ncbi:Sec63 [Lobulomyces angularis]|nr:Sec63 [Lobulomyces angularis]
MRFPSNRPCKKVNDELIDSSSNPNSGTQNWFQSYKYHQHHNPFQQNLSSNPYTTNSFNHHFPNHFNEEEDFLNVLEMAEPCEVVETTYDSNMIESFSQQYDHSNIPFTEYNSEDHPYMDKTISPNLLHLQMSENENNFWGHSNSLVPKNSPQSFHSNMNDANFHYVGFDAPINDFNAIGHGNQFGLQERSYLECENSNFDIIPDDSTSHIHNHTYTELQSVSILPDKFKSLFPFKFFNAVQTLCMESAFYSDTNLVVSAPTGSGKTCILELAIAKLLLEKNGDSSKVIYIAPTKALCYERAKDWQAKFRTLNISVGELTGDVDHRNLKDIQQSNIIVTTPEKWDSMTRKWRDYKNLMNLIRLFLIDEVHMLHEKRGATLEVVVSRMRTANLEIRKGMSHSKLRIIAISATVPNIEDIATWLKNDDESNSSAIVRVFGEEYRPVPIQREIITINVKNSFQMENASSFKTMEVIKKFSDEKPTIIFCPTRKSTLQTADFLSKEINKAFGNTHPFVKTKMHFDHLNVVKKDIEDKKLAEYVQKGIAFHNAGLSKHDRVVIEKAFIDGKLLVLCSTSTLAVGVNLPAHLVIIKGTANWSVRSQSFEEYSDLDILQMIVVAGRAGRPQFDDSAVAVIMTTPTMKLKYEQMVNGGEILESSLHENLIEHLNAEIVLGSITNLHFALEWLKSTFLFVRLRKNPERYNIKRGTSKVSVERYGLEEICQKDLELLEINQFMTRSASNENFKPTIYGEVLAKYYLKFQTCVNFVNLKNKASLSEVMDSLCKSDELENVIRFRSDKQYLNPLNKHRDLKYKVNGLVKLVSDKIKILIQCVLAGIPFPEKVNTVFTNEIHLIWLHICRVGKGLIEIAEAKKDAITFRHAVELNQALIAKSWPSSYCQLKQISGIGPTMAKSLAENRIDSISKLSKAEEKQIEIICNRNPPFGRTILQNIKKFPNFIMNINQNTGKLKSKIIELSVEVYLENPETCKMYNRGHSQAVFICSFNQHLYNSRHFTMTALKKKQTFTFSVELSVRNQPILCSLISEDTVGVDLTKEISINTGNLTFDDILYFPISAISEEKKKLTDYSSDFSDGGINWDKIDWNSADVELIKMMTEKKEESFAEKSNTTEEKEDYYPCCCLKGVIKKKKLKRKRKQSIIESDDDINDSKPDNHLLHDNFSLDPLLSSILCKAKKSKKALETSNSQKLALNELKHLHEKTIKNKTFTKKIHLKKKESSTSKGTTNLTFKTEDTDDEVTFQSTDKIGDCKNDLLLSVKDISDENTEQVEKIDLFEVEKVNTVKPNWKKASLKLIGTMKQNPINHSSKPLQELNKLHSKTIADARVHQINLTGSILKNLENKDVHEEDINLINENVSGNNFEINKLDGLFAKDNLTNLVQPESSFEVNKKNTIEIDKDKETFNTIISSGLHDFLNGVNLFP